MAFPGFTDVQGERRTVGAAEMLVSARPDDILVTYSLGSCIGLTLYDPAAKVGGIIHCLLPSSAVDPEKGKSKPCLFIDTGVAALLKKICDMGGNPNGLIAKVAGGAGLLEGRDLFGIGVRNHKAVRRALRQEEIPIAAEDIGGTAARTMSLQLSTGITVIKSGGREAEI